MAREDLERLEAAYPYVNWREPLLVSTPLASGFACRVCVAVDGLRGEDVGVLTFEDRAKFYEHLREQHE